MEMGRQLSMDYLSPLLNRGVTFTTFQTLGNALSIILQLNIIMT